MTDETVITTKNLLRQHHDAQRLRNEINDREAQIRNSAHQLDKMKKMLLAEILPYTNEDDLAEKILKKMREAYDLGCREAN